VFGEIRLHILLLRCTDTIFSEAADHVEYSLYALGFKFTRPFVGVSCVRAEFQRSLHGSGDIEGDEVQRLLLIWVGGMGRGSHARQVVWTGNDEDFGMMLLALGTRLIDELILRLRLRLRLNCCLRGCACAHDIPYYAKIASRQIPGL
jgi:hypothetical protein